MILYTIKDESKWKEFQETGILKSDDNNIFCNDFLDSYSWLERKMKELLPSSEIKCVHPIWAWYKHDGKRKPDLRRSGFGERGQTNYRIEFEIEDNKVLLTDFSNWHLILNRSEEDKKVEHCCLPLKWFDDTEIEDGLKDGWIISDDKLIYNWNNIIVDKNSLLKDIQATLWYVKIEQVRNVTKFKAR